MISTPENKFHHLQNVYNNGARVASADSEADLSMSLTPHANSVVTDNVLTCGVHHDTRRTIDRRDHDNIPQHFILFFEDMFRRNVGQIREDTSSLLDSKFSVLQTDIHQLHDNISSLDNKFTTLQDQFTGFQSTVHQEISNVDAKLNTVQNHFENTLHDEISSLDTNISDLATSVKTSQDQLGFELRSEMKHSFKSFQQQIQADLQIEMFTLDSKFSASQKQIQSTLDEVISSLETKLFNLDNKLNASHYQLQTTLHDEISSLDTKLQNVESNIDDKFNSLNASFSTRLNRLETKLDGKINSLNTKFDDNFHTLNDKIDTIEHKLDDKINNLETKFSSEINSLRINLFNETNKITKHITALDNKVDDTFHILKENIEALENKMDDKLHGLETKLDTDINSLKTNLQCEVSKLSTQITALDTKFDDKISNLDIKIDNLDTKFTDSFNSLNSKLNNLESQIHTVDNKIDRVEATVNSRMDMLDVKINSVSSKVDALNAQVTSIDSKVGRLEAKVDENFSLLSERLDSVNKTLINFIIQQTKFNNDTDMKILDINKYIQEQSTKITTIEKVVDIHAEQIQDYLKLIDVRKAEIRSEFTKSLTEFSDHLDKRIADLSQSLKSEVAESVKKQDVDLIRQRVSALEITRQSCTPSTDICRPTSISSVNQLMTPNVGLPSKGIGSMPAGTPVVANAAAVSSTNVISCDNPQASYVSTSVIGPVSTPSSVGQSTNNRSQFTGLMAGQPSLDLGNTYSPSVQHVNFDNTSRQHNAFINNEPERTIPSFDGTGDLDAFFRKFEILIKNCNWTEQETLGVLLCDCLKGQAESLLLAVPSISKLTYHDIKTKMYLYFGSGRDQEYYRRQLLEIIRKPGETIQKFCSRVAVLANKAYPLSSREREDKGVAAIIRGCNFESVKRAAITNSFNANTIDEAVSLIMDMENRSQVYRLDKDQSNLRSVNVFSSYDRIPERLSREFRDDDRDLPTNYRRNSDYMYPKRERDERTFTPSSVTSKHHSSRSHHSRDLSPIDVLPRNRANPRDSLNPDNPSACYICGDHDHFVEYCPNK